MRTALEDGMKVIFKEPGKRCEYRDIEYTLQALQKAVGGYIETVTIAEDLVIICNEEGRLKGLPYNCEAAGINFVGNILFVGADEADFTDVTVPIETIERLVIQD